MEGTMLHVYGWIGVGVSFLLAFRGFPKQIQNMIEVKSVKGLRVEQFLYNIIAQFACIGLGFCLHCWYLWLPSILVGIESIVISALWVYYHHYYPRGHQPARG